MKQKITKEIEIPEGIEVKIDGNMINVKGSEGELSREFEMEGINFAVKEGKVVIRYDKATKREKKLINTTAAHIQNMIKGVSEKFEYKLKICFNHFPITIDLKDKDAVIKNFLGEKVPRHAKVVNGAEVKINGQDITITSMNKEVAGQTAANFEKATKVRARDRRIFQDGIFITEKAGREI